MADHTQRALGRRALVMGAMGAGTLAAAPARAAAVRIGAVLWARDSQYWQLIEKGIREGAAKRGAQATFVVNNRQLATETQVTDDLVTRGIDALIFSPIDVVASASMARRVAAANVKIIQYNTFLTGAPVPTVDIGVDNKELGAAVGREAARHIRDDLGGKASVGLISLPPINAGSGPRKEGFLEALKAVQATVVGEAAGSTPEQGANAFENILQREPEVQVIWGSNAGTIAGAAASSRRMQSKARLYGIDMASELAQMMLDPATSLEAVSDQQPYQIGVLAAEAAVNAAGGQSQPQRTVVPTKLYTRRQPDELRAFLDLIKSLNA